MVVHESPFQLLSQERKIKIKGNCPKKAKLLLYF